MGVFACPKCGDPHAYSSHNETGWAHACPKGGNDMSTPTLREAAAALAEAAESIRMRHWAHWAPGENEALFAATSALRTAIAADRVAGDGKGNPCGGVVYVCPERDIECGDWPANWCATCPKKPAASAAVAQGPLEANG